LQVGLHGERKLARVRKTLRLPRPLTRLRKHRKQDRRQYRDNRDYDQQLDEGEPPDACRVDRVCFCPPPAGSPREAEGTKPRAHSVPPACRGNLKEGVVNRSCFCEVRPDNW